MEYAVIENGNIINIIVADSDFASTHYPGSVRVDTITPRPGIGWSYADGAFTATPPPPPPPPSTDFTRLAFRALFTLDELIAIDNYDTSQTLTAVQKATVRTLLANFDAALDIDVADPMTQAGITYMQQVGLLTADRAAAILAGQGL